MLEDHLWCQYANPCFRGNACGNEITYHHHTHSNPIKNLNAKSTKPFLTLSHANHVSNIFIYHHFSRFLIIALLIFNSSNILINFSSHILMSIENMQAEEERHPRIWNQEHQAHRSSSHTRRIRTRLVVLLTRTSFSWYLLTHNSQVLTVASSVIPWYYHKNKQ